MDRSTYTARHYELRCDATPAPPAARPVLRPQLLTRNMNHYHVSASPPLASLLCLVSLCSTAFFRPFFPRALAWVAVAAACSNSLPVTKFSFEPLSKQTKISRRPNSLQSELRSVQNESKSVQNHGKSYPESEPEAPPVCSDCFCRPSGSLDTSLERPLRERRRKVSCPSCPSWMPSS